MTETTTATNDQPPEPTIEDLIREETDRYIEAIADLGKKWAKDHGKKWGQLPTPWKLRLPAEAGRALETAIRPAKPAPSRAEIETQTPSLA